MKIKYLIAYGIPGSLMFYWFFEEVAGHYRIIWSVLDLVFLFLATTYIFLAFKQSRINIYTNLSIVFWLLNLIIGFVTMDIPFAQPLLSNVLLGFVLGTLVLGLIISLSKSEILSRK